MLLCLHPLLQRNINPLADAAGRARTLVSIFIEHCLLSNQKPEMSSFNHWPPAALPALEARRRLPLSHRAWGQAG